MGRKALPEGTVADYVLAVRLDPADRARLDALVADDTARVEAAGLPAKTSPAETVRGLLRQACRARGLLGEAPAAAAPPPAMPPAPSSPVHQDQMLATLTRLAPAAPDGLVDAAALVRDSGLHVPLAHAALEALRGAGLVELRPETSPGLAGEAHLYPRTAAGVIGYVRRIVPPKASKAPAAARDSKPGKAPAKGKTKGARR